MQFGVGDWVIFNTTDNIHITIKVKDILNIQINDPRA
jgi:hypothetical protein